MTHEHNNDWLCYKNVHLNDIYKGKKTKATKCPKRNKPFNYDTLLYTYQVLYFDNIIKKCLYYNVW